MCVRESEKRQRETERKEHTHTHRKVDGWTRLGIIEREGEKAKEMRGGKQEKTAQSTHEHALVEALEATTNNNNNNKCAVK